MLPPPKQHHQHPDAMTTFHTLGRRRDGCRRSSALVVVSCWLAMVAAIAAAKHQPPARPLVSAAADLHTWPTRQQEMADEANDAQLLKAVQQSMREWNRAKAEKQEQPLADHHPDGSSSERQRRRRATAVQPAEKSVCYGDLGCFEDSGPFGYLDMLPSPPEEINTRFMFYSTKNRSDNPLFEIPFLNITDAWRDLQRAANDTATPPPAASSPKSSKRWHALKTFPALTHSSVRIIVHGFGSACPHVWIYELRTALMAVEDCVVICVDWENGANFPNYVRAAANTRLVGKQLAMFLRGLQQYKRLDLNRVHLIGFSLGAHVSGFAGAELPGISRITGLDPAGPLFESQHPKARLDSTDATFVDVIHSNGENLILGGLGSYQPMGHVDFYPNGGRVQHGCSNLFVGAVTDFIWSPAAAVEGRSLCNHRRAYKFFIDSVAPRCLFPAFPCANYDDFLLGLCLPCDTIDGLAATADPSTALTSGAAKCGNMGYYADRSTGRGQLYLVTREEEPFCAHQFNIEIHSPANDLPLRTLGKLEAVLTGDGQLNETFGITEKDDSEFYAGERVSRILVPHPALGFPHAVTLRYKSYSGWLSKGLPQWTVHKVVLTDSFGAKRSLCRPDIALYSDRPVYLQLEAGDCVPDVDDGVYGEEEQQSSTTSASTTSTVTTIAPPGDAAEQNTVMSEYGGDFVGMTTTDAAMQAITDADGLPREKKEVIELGKSYPIQQHAANNKSMAVPWHVLAADNENLIDAPVSVQQLQQQKHDFAIKRYVKTGLSEPETGRSISTADPDAPLRLQLGLRALGAQRGGVEEPVLRSTTLRATAATATVATSTAGRTNPATSSPVPQQPPPEPMRPRENSVFTIQLFPFRLGELIERAERYARETLLPLISEQAPRIFRFGEQAATADVAATGSRNARHLKYIPASGAGKPMTGERLSAAAATASESDVDGVPLMMRRQRRIDLPPQLDAGLRIEQPDFEATETVRGRSLMPNLLRPSGGGMESLRRSFEERRQQQQQQSRPNRYYTAGNGAADEEMVRIALPTYRPSAPSTERATTETSAAPLEAAPPAKVMIVTAIPIPLSAEH